MKKVASVVTVALMALGMVTYVLQNTTTELDFLNDFSDSITCRRCLSSNSNAQSSVA